MRRIIITEGAESSMVSVPKQKKFKCPYCEERIERTKLHLHIQRKHEELIPESFSALRVAFNTINHKNEGHCIIDQSITKWNEDKGRYERLCGKKECLDKYKKIVADRNKRKYGTERLQTDARYAEMVQKRALEGRSISGTYKFSDGGSLGYVGSYEKKFLEFMDMVMQCKSADILSPGPSIPYMFEGKQHFYLPDFYYEPYNLIIEIKDGGKNPNKHPHRIDGERRIKAKEEAIKELDKYSYVRVTDNDFSRLLSIMAVLKYNLSEGNEENIIMDGDSNPIIMGHESALLESEDKSVLEKDHKQKGSMKLSDLRLEIKEKKYDEGVLISLHWKDKSDKLVCWASTDKYPASDGYRWFGDLEISKQYRGYGLGKQIIEFIKSEYKAGALGVAKDNEIAIRLYKQCGFRELERKDSKGQYLYLYYPPNKEKIYKESAINESILFNDEDIYYNKDKFDSGEINLCFITGHSGSGKTTMSNTMQKSNIEYYDLDDLLNAADHFTLIQLKEYGELYFSFFTGIGKKYYLTNDELFQLFEKGAWSKPLQYEREMYQAFISYAMKYAKVHRNIKFVLDGIWIYCYDWFRPEEFKDYAVYIKGTSMLVSKIRAAKRDKKGVIKFLSRKWKFYHMNEKRLQEFRNYFERLMMKNEFNEDMVGTIGAALPNMPAPNPNHNNYYIVQHRSDDNFIYGITQDPDYDSIYEVEPKSNGVYKINKTNKQEIGKDCYIAYKIKNKEAAKEIYHELHNLVKYNKNVFCDNDYPNAVSYIYSRVTEGSNIVDHSQLEYDTRFEKVKSIDDEILKITNEMYDYLINGQNNIDLLETQVDELQNFQSNYNIQKSHDSNLIKYSGMDIPIDWNTEVPFNEESMDLFCNHISSTTPIIPSIPLENISESDLENINNKNLTPIYVVLFSGNRIENQITKLVTKSKWTHVAISLDESLNHMYSYLTSKNGFFDADLNYYIRQIINGGYKIYIKVQALFVTAQQKSKISNLIKFYKEHVSMTSYDMGALISVLFNKLILNPINNLSHICSSFVYSLLRIANIKITSNFPVIMPGDLELIDHKKSYSVYEGSITNYNPSIVTHIISKLKRK